MFEIGFSDAHFHLSFIFFWSDNKNFSHSPLDGILSKKRNNKQKNFQRKWRIGAFSKVYSITHCAWGIYSNIWHANLIVFVRFGVEYHWFKWDLFWLFYYNVY